MNQYDLFLRRIAPIGAEKPNPLILKKKIGIAFPSPPDGEGKKTLDHPFRAHAERLYADVRDC